MNIRRVSRVVAIAAALAGLAAADEWHRTYPAEGNPELRVETTDGSVDIRGGDVHQIRVRVVTTGWKIRPGEVRVDERQSGNRIEIVVHTPRTFFSLGQSSVKVAIEAPRGTVADIHTADGDIRAEGLRGQTRLTSGDGRIETDILDGSLEAETGDGHMKIRGRFDMLNLRTGDGGIEARIGPGSKMAGPWRIKSGGGAVAVSLPEGFAADLDAHTGDGEITLGFPVTASGPTKGSTVQGKINGGGPLLNIRTSDGTIHLQRL